MFNKRSEFSKIMLRLLVPAFIGVLLVSGFVSLVRFSADQAYAAPSAPVNPPAGYPKFILSHKTVTPDLAPTGGVILRYRIDIINTGAYTGFNVIMTDTIPLHTTYRNDGSANRLPAPTFQSGKLSWKGTVGFDKTVVISFSVNVTSTFSGVISNTALISHSSLPQPLRVSAEAMITDHPIFEISKKSYPAIPGPNKPLTYTISILNIGQTATNLPVTVTDDIPANTTYLRSVGGVYSPSKKTVTWNTNVNLATGQSANFIYAVQAGDVNSGTVISNDNYRVQNPESGIAMGEVHTTTIRDPQLFLYKETDPFPPGSNRPMTYTLIVLNKGSLATNLVISDTIPAGVTYLRSNGTRNGNVVTWNLASLDNGQTARVYFVVSVGDVAEVGVLNGNYKVCSAEGVCQTGAPLNSIIKGPTFVAQAFLDPIAKKPGGGGGPVTPTLTIQNIGPGNALNAMAILRFSRISVSANSLYAIPPVGTLPPFPPGPACGSQCVTYLWRGDLPVGQLVTFTTFTGQSTIGGTEGVHYTATVVVTDTLGGFSYEPVTATAVGRVTHLSNLIPEKSAPAQIGAGQRMTYTIEVFNSGLSTNTPPFPTLTDAVPDGTSLVSIGGGGVSNTLTGTTVVAWTLPAMSPGDRLSRSYSVRVDPDLVSGTLIVNDGYFTSWSNTGITSTEFLSNTGEPITTVVKEVGLIDSFKSVTPKLLLPGEDNLLTYTLHIRNTGPYNLTGVKLFDLLPWQVSTYQRDATASGGQVISDIVSLNWTGDVGAFSEKLITLTVLVDPNYTGPVTNTMVISHSSLLDDVIDQAVSYVTDQPVLRITKAATPDPVHSGGELLYTIQVENLGQQATELVVTDTIPLGSQYVPSSASGNGQLSSSLVTWQFPVLPAGGVQLLSFKVEVNGLLSLVNANYGVSCAEGVKASGPPVVTTIIGNNIYLPLVRK
jgi:uncharacterized repeat protein (TIGR01451 family)